jgi:Cu/Zn superoxide dismutase
LTSTRLLRNTRVLLACAFGIALAGCGDQPPEQDFYVEPELPDNPTELTDAAAAQVADRAALPPESELLPVDGSGVTGDVTVTTGPDGVAFTLAVAGLPGAGEYGVHVHRGVCVEGGPVAAALTAVTGAADGTGSSTTRLPASDVPANEPVFVQLHAPTGTPLACGDLVEAEP